jgi:hypothetical protein
MISRPEVFSRGLLEDGIGLVERLTIDVDLLGSNFDVFARKGHNTLDVILGSVGLFQVLEHHDVSTMNFGERQEALRASTSVVAKAELVDEKVISRQKGVFHTTSRNLNRFCQESSYEEDDHYREDKGFEVLTEMRLDSHGCRHSLAVDVRKINRCLGAPKRLARNES